MSFLKPGDWLLLLLAGLSTLGLFVNAWTTPAGSTVIVRAQGKVMVRGTLDQDALYAVHGKLGLSRIEVRQGRARVVADPGPRQIFVKQGWMSRAGEAALCLEKSMSDMFHCTSYTLPPFCIAMIFRRFAS